MAKKKAAVIVPEEVIQVTEMVIIPKDTETQALALIDPFAVKLDELKHTYGNIEITDKTTLETAQKGLAYMVALRNQAEKHRLAIFRPVMKLNSDVKAVVDKFSEEVKVIEKGVSDKINAEEIRLQEQARAERQRRNQLLTDSGWTLAGEWYRVGPHQIFFDQVEDATEVELAQWVKLGTDFLESERLRVEAEKQRLLEIEQREAALRAQEAEMAEFRAWKAAQAAAAQVQPTVVERVAEIVHTPPTAGTLALPDQVSFEQERTAHVQELAPSPNIAPSSPLEQLARFRNSSVSHILSQPEAKVFWNMAIDHVHAVFTTSTEQLTKVQWAEVFLRQKR
jgi:hypothetical protein